MSGPIASASTRPIPTSDATRNQRPRTSSPLRRRLRAPMRPRAPRPARETPTARRARARSGAQEYRRGEHDPGHQLQSAACGTEGGTGERQAVRADRPISFPRSISTSAIAVAACTSPKPSSASVVPRVTTSSTSAPAPSPDVSTPSSPKPPSTSACTSEITIPSGMKIRPMPRNSRSAPRRVHPRGAGQDPPPGAPVCEAKRRRRAPAWCVSRARRAAGTGSRA